MRRLLLSLTACALLAIPLPAAALPIQYHVAFTLNPQSLDPRGFGGADFDMWLTIDADTAPIHQRLATSTSWLLSPTYTNLEMQIRNSRQNDGSYLGTAPAGAPEFYARSDGFSARDVAFNVDSFIVALGFLRVAVQGIDGAGPIFNPTAFDPSQVTGTTFNWVEVDRLSYLPVIRSASAHAVPEPGTLLLLGAGLSLAAVQRFRRKTARV